MGKKMVWLPEPGTWNLDLDLVMDFRIRPAKLRGSVKANVISGSLKVPKCEKPVAVGTSPRRFPQASMHGIFRGRIWGAARDPDLHSARLDICRACISLS